MKKFLSMLSMVVPLIMLLGCAHNMNGQFQHHTEMTAAAAGLGFDVEYIEPQKYRDPGDRTRVYFPVKFVCGETEPGDRFVPASYSTGINVQNLSKFKAKIGWHFSTLGNSFPGAQAAIPSFGFLGMECDFIITNLLNKGVDVGTFVEGFTIIEDLTGGSAVRVVAVYSVLHKQVHELPDLLPVETERNFCKLDAEGRLIVTIKNKGEEPAPSSTARITFSGSSPVDRFTKALLMDEQVDLEPIDIPNKGDGTFSFTIFADVNKEIKETNESNNTVMGACKIIQ